MSSSNHIYFNRPYVTGKEQQYIQRALDARKLSGDGSFTRQCQQFFEEKYGFRKSFLTTSCTHALEMAALLLEVQPGDEIIMPSYTYVSTANAFALRGAKILFADSSPDHPNIDPKEIEKLLTHFTKAVVLVHYAGMACDINAVTSLQKLRDGEARIVEDAAHAIGATYFGKPLGFIGDFGAMSFHETKNITSGEGGLLTIHAPQYYEDAEIIREKGTNRKAFFRGETDRYSWVNLGSSYLPSEITAAFLAAQLESLDEIQAKRTALWFRYHDNLKSLAATGRISLPVIPEGASINGHLYYIICGSLDERTELMKYLAANEIDAVFHYLSLHSSPYFREFHDGRPLPNSDKFMERLLRLPMYFELSMDDVDRVCERIESFYRK